MFLLLLSRWGLFSLGVPLAGGNEQGYEEGPETCVVGEASPVRSCRCVDGGGCGSRLSRAPERSALARP